MPSPYPETCHIRSGAVDKPVAHSYARRQDDCRRRLQGREHPIGEYCAPLLKAGFRGVRQFETKNQQAVGGESNQMTKI